PGGGQSAASAFVVGEQVAPSVKPLLKPAGIRIRAPGVITLLEPSGVHSSIPAPLLALGHEAPCLVQGNNGRCAVDQALQLDRERGVDGRVAEAGLEYAGEGVEEAPGRALLEGG